MSIRDAVEDVIRAWHRHQTIRGAAAVIDFDLHPVRSGPSEPNDLLTTFLRLRELNEQCTEPVVRQRIGADLAYLRALMGERPALDEYVRATQGCPAAGWPADYVAAVGETARRCLGDLGVSWSATTGSELTESEGPLSASEVADAIRQATAEYEPAVRRLAGTDAVFDLTIEEADADAYWAYWLDGAGSRVRLRMNTRNASFTKVRARQMALHEVLGHGLQSASMAARCAVEDVAWVRLLSVHGPQQVLLEGWAQAMPLFLAPDDDQLIARTRLAHYTHLVRAELQLALNAGSPIESCVEHAQSRVPWWNNNDLAGILADRSTDPLLRSYMWAYAAGIDWFTHLAAADPGTISAVVRAAYRAPLTPTDLESLWPEGPRVGGGTRGIDASGEELGDDLPGGEFVSGG
ncbi:hypothetical protein ACFYTQ_18960 [Nocardia sp. NPDC004068]|uniref:hypothetical protein n=1 Tax=Nocardia sp. NPDC004068 TaxID=3364303 RepID=UPI00368FBC99